MTKDDYYSYLRNPAYLKLYNRPTSSLPALWKDANSEPSLKYTGLDNIRRLSAGLLFNLRGELAALLQLTDVSSSDNQYYFHHFRKMTRSVLYLTDTFDIFDTKVCSNYSEAITTLEKSYDKLGDVNDVYNQYDYYLNKGDDGKANAAKEELKTEWADFVTWTKRLILMGSYCA